MQLWDLRRLLKFPTKKWTNLTNMNEQRFGYALVIFRGFIFAVGGPFGQLSNVSTQIRANGFIYRK